MFPASQGKVTQTLLTIVATIAVVGSGLAAYEYRVTERTNQRILIIENQLDRLTDAIAEAADLDEETKAELKELANRSDVVSKDVPKLEIVYEDPFGGDPFFGNYGIRIPRYRQIGTEKQQIGAGTGF